MSDLTLRVRLDGYTYQVRLRDRHWFPRLTGYAGASIGLTIYLRDRYETAHPALIGHELVHTLDFVRRWRRAWVGSYPLAVAWDLAAYVWAWVRVGFRYHRIPEEVRAYGEQYLVVYDNHPHIQIDRGTP